MLTSHFCSFMVVWGWVSWIKFLGLRFSVDGVSDQWYRASGVFGVGALYINIEK
mgnify:CR=1 FL=1